VKNRLKVSQERLLLFSVFVLSLCGITYELVLGSLATYLLGNPVQQYSLTIGIFLSSMGIGSYLSRFLVKNILRDFIIIEIALGFIGGLSVLLLNMMFSFSVSFYLLHIFLLTVIGTLVGLEIPLMARILRKHGSFRDIISNVLTLDYMGGLAGSLLFPLLLFPFIGRFLTSLLIGIANISVAALIILRIEYPGRKKHDIFYPLVMILLLALLAFNSDMINTIMQKRLFYDDIVFSKRSKYQEIVLTRSGEEFRLYLDGSLQFSTFDEYRYHEMLVYPALALHPQDRKRVLILGGGDGIAVGYVLKWKGVENITLVELDPEIINLARSNSSFKMINKNSLEDERVEVVTGDAYRYLTDVRRKFDLIIADFPDPHDETISKLYTTEFFMMVKRTLAPGGIFVTQSTSPLFAREAFWCINTTLEKVFRHVLPYHVFIPSFGDWGFNMASEKVLEPGSIGKVDIKTSFFSRETFGHSLHFPDDSERVSGKINTFNTPVLYTYYLKGWKTTDY
jgi:spermidine synthase